MIYRPEIDGLRALAVIPVILFHAGFQTFSGGFVGVDIFFVISGYLITTIISTELDTGSFSIITFYERRARRILPALFAVMVITSIFAYAWMMPDELKRYGQSLVATLLFSNNILLTLTSGYWSFEAEFKPLLHTWSLGVEEQYYLLFPLLLIGLRKFSRTRIYLLIIILIIISFSTVLISQRPFPELTFYLLPTRAWELMIGSLAALYIRSSRVITKKLKLLNLLSGLGLISILASIEWFNASIPHPGISTIAPTAGAAMIILFAHQGTFVNKLLSSRLMVGLGLISYSAYLWHWPLFCFARIYSVSQPNLTTMAFIALASLPLAFISWKFIELPFRSQIRVKRRNLLLVLAALSVPLAVFGLYASVTHGIPKRMYSSDIVNNDDMYILYNHSAYKYKKDTFSDENTVKILIAGNSFGRDFVNMTVETFSSSKIELIYRDDFDECMAHSIDTTSKNLYAKANIIVFASGGFRESCVSSDISRSEHDGKNLFYTGSKQFGYNLNWLVRIPDSERANRFNPLTKDVIEKEVQRRSMIPKKNFISLVDSISVGPLIQVTDNDGQLISFDRGHLTKQGAKFIGIRALYGSLYGRIISAW